MSAFVAFMNMRHLRCSCSAWLRHWSVFCSWPPCARLLWIFFCPNPQEKTVNKSYIARMPKQPMKYRNLPPWPEAKRGKKRANIKRPAKYISMKKKNEKIPYVRAPGVRKKFKKERLRYGVSVQSRTSKGCFQLIQRLMKDGLLPSWKGKPCPHCSQGSLSSLKYNKAKCVWSLLRAVLVQVSLLWVIKLLFFAVP